jgi:DNA polymerase sigma
LIFFNQTHIKQALWHAMLSPSVVGKAILDHHAALLGADLSVKRVHEAHSLVKNSLDSIAPELKLYTFGSSTVFGFHEPKSDVDFVALREEDIVDGKGGDSTSQLAKGLQTQLLAKLAASVRQKNVQWTVEEVRRARVPVVKVKAPHIDFDITAHRRNGVRNSALLRHYLTQAPENRWLSIAIKSWSKRVGMNGPVGGYLTSYGFNILVVYYLLHRRRHEQLQSSESAAEGDVPNVGSTASVTFIDKDSLDVALIPAIPEYVPLEPPNPEALGEQVLDFFDFYLSRFPMESHVISLSHKEPITKQSLNWTKTAEDMKNNTSMEKVFYRLCIEDPYEVNLNVGRNVSPFKFDLMKKHFVKGRATALGLV